MRKEKENETEYDEKDEREAMDEERRKGRKTRMKTSIRKRSRKKK